MNGQDQAQDSAANDRVAVNLPANVIAQIDALIGSEFTDREDFMRASVRHYLGYLQHIQRTTQRTDIG